MYQKTVNVHTRRRENLKSHNFTILKMTYHVVC
jgi:hypothetical protein